MSFITNVTVSILTAECRACTAPGVQESLAINNQKPQRMAIADAGGAQEVIDKAAKNRARKLRAKAKAAESRAAAQASSKGGAQKRALELQNGGVGDSR